jgi:fatty acid-binding protein DegV
MYEGVSGIEKVRTQKKAIKRLSEMLREHGPFEKIALLYSGSVQNVNTLMEEIRDLLSDVNPWVEVLNPILGAHLGPGVFGFACVSKK